MSVSGDRVEEGTSNEDKPPDSRSDDQRQTPESPEHSNEPDSQTKGDQSQRPVSPAPSSTTSGIFSPSSTGLSSTISDEPGPSHSQERNISTEDPSRGSVCDHPTSIVQMDVSLQEVLKPYKTSLTQRSEGQREDITGPGPGTPLNRIYTTLYLIHGDSEGVNQQHEVWQLERASKMEKTSLDNTILCSDIFNPLPGTETPFQRVLTKGIAGIGKTFSVYKFIQDWAEGVANQDIDLLIPISFRELNLVRDKRYSLLTLIHDFHPTLKELTAEQLAACKTVFIFDGLDESKISLSFRNIDIVSDVTVTSSVGVLLTNLIERNLLPSALLWVTTRPAAANQIPPACVDRVTEVRGFTDPQKEEYFRKRFSDEKLASTIITHINKTRSLHIMCHIPLICWIAATVLEDMLKTMLKTDKTGQLPTTPTEMYCHFLLIQTRRKKQKYDETDGVSQQQLMKSDWEVLLKLGRLAFEHLEKGSIMFYQEDLEECGLDVTEASLYSGVCTEIFKRESVLFQTKVYSFVHLSIQEFLAAVYLFRCFTEKNMKVLKTFLGDDNSHMSLDDFLKKAMLKALKSKNGHLDLFVRFLHGLSLPSNQSLLGGLLGQTENSPESIQRAINNLKEMNADGGDASPDRCINIFHCLMEMKDESVHQEIQRYLKSGDRSKTQLSDTQCSALAYMLLMSEEVLDEFDPDKYNASYQGRRRLLPAVRNCRKARLADCTISETTCEVLVSALSSNPSHLVELEISDGFLNDATVKMLCDAMKSPHCRLKILTLSNCRLSESCCGNLASVLCSNSSLHELDLSHNDLSDSGVSLLLPGLESQQCRLKILRLRQTNLTEKCCKELSSLFSSNSCSLTELDLSYNELQNSGVNRLSIGLKSPHCTLEILRLSHCLVSEEGFSCLASALRSNLSHLKELDLSFNRPGDSGGEQLLSVGLATLKLDQEEEHSPQLLKTCVCPLTLDTNTTGPFLSLSENNRKVTFTSEDQSYPDHPDRFQIYPQVLCREGLTGCCYWEVEWSGRVYIAVTYRGINRRGEGDDCLLGYNDKSWSLECHDGDNRYSVCHNKKKTVLPVRPSGSYRVAEHGDSEDSEDRVYRVAVYVDWSAGVLSFYRVSSDSHTHLYTFQTTFTEPLYAGFMVWGEDSSVSLCQIEPVVPSSFSPIVHTEQTTNEYRFQVPGAGLFRCSDTGLVFGTTGEGEVLYRTVQWDKRCLQSTGGTPAGPLFDIQCPQKSVRRLHLPHCAITPGDDLAVVHITDDGMKLLEPLEVTKTHVVVNVTHLSIYGLLWKMYNYIKPTFGQVLLFRQPPRRRKRTMSVLLLPSNVLIEQVMRRYTECEYIPTTATCELTPYQRYSLQCTPYKVQPKAVKYVLDYGHNFHPAFEVKMDLNAEDVSLTLLGPENEEVWQRDIDLEETHPDTRPIAPTTMMTSQGAETLLCVRSEFVARVSEPVLNGLLDKLLEEKVLNDEEMNSIRSKAYSQEKARQFIDMVRNKGDIASARMIAALHQLDPTLHHHLGLHHRLGLAIHLRSPHTDSPRGDRCNVL